jgi:hypothetical protein
MFDLAAASEQIPAMKLSVRKLILYDYPSCGAWIVISVLWLTSVASRDARQALAQGSGYFVFLSLVTILPSAVVVWRIYRASRLFRSGHVAAGRITAVWVALKGPTTFDFAFDHEDRRIRAKMHVMGWRKVQALKRGQTVEVLYDPTHPARAIISQLFQA